MPTVVISPFNVVNFPEGGGHFWVYMQYVQGLRKLGCDVYWLERFRSTGSEDADAARLALFLQRMRRFGLGGKTILYSSDAQPGQDPFPKSYLGLNVHQAEAVFERA